MWKENNKIDKMTPYGLLLIKPIQAQLFISTQLKESLFNFQNVYKKKSYLFDTLVPF